MSTCPCHYSLPHHPPLSCWATTGQQPSPVTPSQHAANIFMFIIIQILSNVYNIPYLKLSKNLLLLIDLLFLAGSFCSSQHGLNFNDYSSKQSLSILFVYLDVRLRIKTLLFQTLKNKARTLEKVRILKIVGVSDSLLLQVTLVCTSCQLSVILPSCGSLLVSWDRSSYRGSSCLHDSSGHQRIWIVDKNLQNSISSIVDLLSLNQTQLPGQRWYDLPWQPQ